MIIIPINKKKEKSKKPKVFLEYVKRRIENNKNLVAVFNGDTGSGKSYACIKCALELSELLGTNFSIKKNLDFSFIKLLEKMKLPGNDKPGTIFVMEEVGSFGSGASAREWQSQANKFFFSFMQTARSKNQVLLLNCPSFSYLEKGSRELVHFQFEALGINMKNKQSYFKPSAIQCNRKTGKLYFKYLRYYIDGVKHRYNKIHFGLPHKAILNSYEQEKAKFLEDLSARIRGEKEDKKNKNDRNRNDKIIIKKLLKSGNSTKEIAELTDYSLRQIQRYKRELIENGILEKSPPKVK